jgi:hypothetical protein
LIAAAAAAADAEAGALVDEEVDDVGLNIFTSYSLGFLLKLN